MKATTNNRLMKGATHSISKVNNTAFRMLLMMILICGSVGVWAGDYVIFNGTYYFVGVGNNQSSANNDGCETTSFSPKSCVWTGTSGNTFHNENGYYLVYWSGYPGTKDSEPTNCTLSGTENKYTGQQITIGKSTYRYLYYGSYWDLSSKSSDAANCVFKVTTNSYSEQSVNPVISGAATLSTKGESQTYSTSTAPSYIPAYYDYVFYNGNHHYFLTDKETALDSKPTTSEDFNYVWSLSDNANGYVSVNSKTGVVTYDKIYLTDTQVTLTLTATSTVSNKVLTATKTITFKASTVDPTGITITCDDPIRVYTGFTENITYKLTPTTCYDNVVYESADESIATVNNKGAVTGVNGGTTTITVKALKYSNSSEYFSATVNVVVIDKVATPIISFSQLGDGSATTTISCTTTGATIRYTTDGSEPSATNGSVYSSAFTVSPQTTVKAIAIKNDFVNSNIASEKFELQNGIIEGVVILSDYEDHNWTYYQKAENLPAGYPADYISSPDPRNVKITYKGGSVSGASAVAISGLSGENQNTMIYYKTLEKHDLSVKDDGEYAYTVISNPFSKRPKKGTTYYGFGGWKIVSGGEYIDEYDDGETLPLDETIHFTNLDNNYTPNCTSGEVVFEATWVTATVKTGTSVQSFSGGNYETNFWVINGNSTGGTVNSPCTVTMMTPDGGATNDYRNSATLSGVITPGTNGVKVEFVRMNTTSAISANSYNYTLGRGIISTASTTNTGGLLSGSNSNKDCVNTVKIESGIYNYLYAFYSDIDANKLCDLSLVIGCDYDRAKNDNSKLTIKNHLIGGSGIYLHRKSGDLYLRYIVKSGNLWTNQSVKGDKKYTGGINQNFYLSFGGVDQVGHRFLLMEGGRVSGIAGGQDSDDSQKTTDRAVDMRIRGTAQIDGNVYGAAEYAGGRGIRTMIFTGGNINGWIAGGANGTQATGGLLEGSTYVYVGGNTTVKSDLSYPKQVMNRAVGGNVFGAGCGFGAESTSGKVTLGTNVVVSDKAYIERGVYGGGSYGFCANDKTSSLFILGGQIAGKPGGVDGASYDATVQGGVYGGACQNIGGSANIHMDAGLVETGLYGGSNKTGTLSGNVKIQVDGGQIGTKTDSANIHGGGYGSSTLVNGNVDITIGKANSDRDADGAVVYGDVYGGSALGKVNGTSTSTTLHTNVTLNAGEIHGSIYGGGLGDATTAANVYAPVQVTVNGGSVIGDDAAVYGCNNVNGAPQSTVKVDIYGTNSAPSADAFALNAVYGGGNMAHYKGTPLVTVHGCNNSIGYVYGGGNAADVQNTDVTIWGGNKIGYVFGGGHGDKDASPQKSANVGGTNVGNTGGNVAVKIYGGTIGKVFAGSNSKGTINGTVSLTVNKDGEGGTDGCEMHIDEVYGGGNLADGNAGSISIGCTGGDTEGIGTVYGGANNANIGTSSKASNITLNITGGSIDNVFGGNNNGGTIYGTITVNANWTGTCGTNKLGNVYGAGNIASYTTPTGKTGPTVNIINCTTTGSVFGGGKGKEAVVVGDPIVNIGDWDEGHSVIIGGDVFGGGDLAAVEGNPNVTIRDCGTLINGNLYGGGNAAPVYSTNTTMWGGTVKGNVFGGGNGSDATKNAKGAQVGYKRNDETKEGSGNAVTKIFGGTVGTWSTVDGVEQCTDGGGIFGGSNTTGNIAGKVDLTLDEQTCTETGANKCTLKIKEIYGAGNEAAYAGTGINFNLGCVSALSEIYGGAKKANLSGDVHLVISSGHFNKVFAGNNLGGNIDGSIKVTIEETGCNPVIIDELYGGGNMAAYTTPSGKAQPEVEVISCTHIGQVFGGGYGKSAVVTGNPIVNINQIPGKFAKNIDADSNGTADNNENALGSIGTVFGGGNAANVVGNTNVNIGTKTKVTLSSGDSTYKDQTFDVKGVNITGNVYGGGNAADVTGKTNVTVGK